MMPFQLFIIVDRSRFSPQEGALFQSYSASALHTLLLAGLG